MFKEEFIKQAWSLYQASLKHSCFEIDVKKADEERNEFFDTWKIKVDENDDLYPSVTDQDSDVIEESTDYLIMFIRLICHILKPKSYDDLVLYCNQMSEVAEHKTERTLKRFEEGFYK